MMTVGKMASVSKGTKRQTQDCLLLGRRGWEAGKEENYREEPRKIDVRGCDLL